MQTSETTNKSTNPKKRFFRKSQEIKNNSKKLKTEKQKELPSNSRFIPEKKHFKPNFNKWFRLPHKPKSSKKFPLISLVLTLITIIVLISLTGIMIFKFYENTLKYNKLSSQREEIYGKINFWNSIVEKYPGFTDAYFNLAINYYAVGDFIQSRKYLTKTFVLNPSYTNTKELDVKLAQKGY